MKIREYFYKVGKSKIRCTSTYDTNRIKPEMIPIIHHLSNKFDGFLRCDLKKGHNRNHRSISWLFKPHVIEWNNSESVEGIMVGDFIFEWMNEINALVKKRIR